MLESMHEVKKLWRRSNGRCSFPDCGASLISHLDGVSLLSDQLIAPLLHNDRSDPTLGLVSSADAVLLCPNHRRLLDHAPEMFSPEMMRLWKIRHERQVTGSEQAPHFADQDEGIAFLRDKVSENEALFRSWKQAIARESTEQQARLTRFHEFQVIEIVVPNHHRMVDALVQLATRRGGNLGVVTRELKAFIEEFERIAVGEKVGTLALDYPAAFRDLLR